MEEPPALLGSPTLVRWLGVGAGLVAAAVLLLAVLLLRKPAAPADRSGRKSEPVKEEAVAEKAPSASGTTPRGEGTLAALAAGGRSTASGGKLALLVGVRDYDSGNLSPLQYPENDVEELARILQSPEAGFAHVRLLTSTRGKAKPADAPTAANLRAAVKALLARRKRDDVVLVALAGHGLSLRNRKTDSDESFFCPSDTETGDPGSMIGLNDLFAQLDACGAGVKLLLVDACRNDPTAGRSLDADNLPRPPRGIGALYSCSHGEKAWETDKLGPKGHGVFFHFVLEGLRGKAKDEEQKVTWARLTEYVSSQVPRKVKELFGSTGAKQTPHLTNNLTGESPVLMQVSQADRLFRQAQEADAAGKAADGLEAARLYQLAMAKGHPLAAGHLGVLYAAGRGIPRDKAKARKLCLRAAPAVKEAAGRGTAAARFLLGEMHRGGLGVSRDAREAARWYRQAAEQDHEAAQEELGLLLANGRGVEKDPGEAARWLRKAAEKGRPRAQYQFGRLQAGGLGMAKNDREAVAWYRRAAEQGYAQAQTALGLRYRSGRGVSKDDREAARWFRQAAEQGDARAQYNLGLLCEKGLGVAKDHREAARWYRQAAEQDQPQAQGHLGRMYEQGLGVAKDHDQAARWYRKAADHGVAEFQNDLGECYFKGRGVPKDFDEALRLFRLAAAQGLAAAHVNLAEHYMSGAGVTKDEQEAVRLYRKAAEMGDTEGQVRLATELAQGQRVAQDYREAVRWFHKAAAQGNAAAQRSLGIMHELGQGVRQDRAEALKWYRKAVAAGDKQAKERLSRIGR
jgi:TPR repeat protein